MAVHAIGDRANWEAMDAFEHLPACESENGLPRLRQRIEHLQMLYAAVASRLGHLNVTASMQPIHARSDMLMADRYRECNSVAHAVRTQSDLDVRVAFGFDVAVESPNSFWGIHAAVTLGWGIVPPGSEGWHPEQRLRIREAVKEFTTGPAYAANAENRLGSVAAGCLAHLIALDIDALTCDPHELRNYQSSATMVGGEWVFQS